MSAAAAGLGIRLDDEPDRLGDPTFDPYVVTPTGPSLRGRTLALPRLYDTTANYTGAPA